jgi:hypothetical protein
MSIELKNNVKMKEQLNKYKKDGKRKFETTEYSLCINPGIPALLINYERIQTGANKKDKKLLLSVTFNTMKMRLNNSRKTSYENEYGN